jgi:hypothetical protein
MARLERRFVLNAANAQLRGARIKHGLSDPPRSYRLMMSHLLPLVDATTGE